MKDCRLWSSCIVSFPLKRTRCKVHGNQVPYGCDTIGKHTFPSHGWEYRPQAALLHQFPPFLAQRQLRGSPAALAPARQTGQLLALLPSVLCQCFGFSTWVCFGLLWFLNLNQSWSHTQLRSCCLKSILLLCHSQGWSCCSKEKGWGKLQSGWLGCLISLNFCPVWPYVSNTCIKFYSCVHLRVMLGTGNHR